MRAVDDPRDAAIVLMLLMARVDGYPIREQIAAIEQIIRAAFVLEGELVERMTQARFIAKRAENFEQAAGLFSDILNKRLTIGEQFDLISMLRQITQVDGPPDAKLAALNILQHRLGLTAAC